ncbi:hypothetical protein MSAN_02263900 [Mycena sanguinolenta]|uniref:DUF6534 domain-containing protein n=1 Tax=Mycena sanguinolenta TaxID=230812 RepID=A0A8H7CJ73_9AGAR|nr:hypothetical protein MSAN_02263900 [Mycena sanguinolenta]
MTAYGVDSPAILGALEIGVFLNLVIFGVVAFQGRLYFQNCPDKVGLKLLVGSILFFELCHSVASCHAIYFLTVTLAGIPEQQKLANSYSLALLFVFEPLVTGLVQGFFACRVWLLSGRTHISLICWGLCLLRFVGGVAMAVEAFLNVPLELDYFHLQDAYGWLITSTLTFNAVLDVLMAVSLGFYIRQLYTSYDLPRSEELMHRRAAFTIQTRLITSLTSIVIVIFLQSMKHNLIWLALYIVLPKLYSNSLLVSLSARPRNRNTVRALLGY